MKIAMMEVIMESDVLLAVLVGQQQDTVVLAEQLLLPQPVILYAEIVE